MSETPTLETTFLKNLWDAREAAALEAKPLELLRYRSNLLRSAGLTAAVGHG